MKFIPKIIHQTYYKKEIPLILNENINKIKSMNPGWEYRFYDDNDIERYFDCFFPWALEMYRRINPSYGAVKADFFRYFLMYREGGVYLDIKSSISKPLKNIIRYDDQYLLSHWDNSSGEEYEGVGIRPEIPLPKGEFIQWFIVAAPKHPFLKIIIDSVCENFRNYSPYSIGTGGKGTLRLAGPTAYTLSILKNFDKHNFRLVDSVKDLGFVYTVYSDKHDHKKLYENHYSTQKSSILKNVDTLKLIKTYFPYRLNRWRFNIKRKIKMLSNSDLEISRQGGNYKGSARLP